MPSAEPPAGSSDSGPDGRRDDPDAAPAPRGGAAPATRRRVAVRRLVLVRHAKSARPSGVPDRDRPLAGRGRRDAQAAAEWFLGEGPHPDLVLCSPAQRARQTWQVMGGLLRPAPKVSRRPRLYAAGPQEILDEARACPDAVRTVAVVGHEPTLSTTSLLLAGPGSDPTALAALSAKFPTGAIAVFRLTGTWAALQPGRAVLERFVVPRG